MVFKDARGKTRKIHTDEKKNNGIWGLCTKSAFVTIETLLNVFFEKNTKLEVHTLEPLEAMIFRSNGDLLRLNNEAIPGDRGS